MALKELSLCILFISFFWNNSANTVTTTETTTTTTTEQTIQNDDKIIEEDLGFLLKKGKIKIAKSLEKYKFAVSVPTLKEADKIELTMTRIGRELDRVSTIPAVKDGDKQHHKDLNKLWSKTQKSANMILNTLYDIATYSNPDIGKTALLNCSMQMNTIDDTLFGFQFEKIKTIIDYMDLTATKEDYDNDKSKFLNLIDQTEIINEILNSVYDYLHIRLDTLEGLSRLQITPSLSKEMQNAKCMGKAEMERIEVDFCEKQEDGIYCMLDVTTYQATQTYQTYYAVNYRNVELATTDREVYAKNEDGEMGKLQCNDKIPEGGISPYLECHFLEGEQKCLETLTSRKLDNILKNCKFMSNIPKPVSKTKYGFLLMGNNITSIREIDKAGKTLYILPKKLPIYVEVNNDLQVTYGGYTTTYRPDRTVALRKILKTWMTNKDLSDLALWSEIYKITENLDTEDYFDLIVFVILGIVIPVLCILGFKACKTSNFCINWENKRFFKRKDDPNRENFMKNQEILMAPILKSGK